jgi:hypothetical protein
MMEEHHYKTVLLEIKNWKLLKKTDPDWDGSEHYDSMLYHKCSASRGGGYNMRNGVGKQVCYGCDEIPPDEIWALWLLHNEWM